jgi:hypothetical protein
MDHSKPPIPPSEFGLRSASKRTSAGIDAAPEAQSDPPDRPVAVYCRNEAEVREGFLVALRVMGVAVIEQYPEPAKLPVRGAKP